MNKCIMIRLCGGLGNQMFQYAFGRRLSLSTNLPLLLDDRAIRKDRLRDYALGNFKIHASIASKYKIACFAPFPLRVYRKFRWAPLRPRQLPVYFERGFSYNPEALVHNQGVYLDGYWQSPKYFSDIRETLLNDFSLQGPLPEKCQEIASKIKATDAVCVHIRRGDYVTNPAAAATHGLCSLDYYRRGLERVAHKLSNPQIFIFSDDADWVRSNFSCDYPVTIVDVNSGAEAHWDLHLMALCKHFVIANSSLSWWAAWLGQYESKQVVAPDPWFLDASKDTSDLLPDDWVSL